MKTIKVLLYTDVWNDGGIEKYISNFIKESSGVLLEYELLTFNKKGSMFDSSLNEYGVKINIISDKNYKNPILRTIFSFKQFISSLKKINFDILHINVSNGCGLIYAFLAKSVGIKKIIVHAHNSGIDNDILGIKHFASLLSKYIFTSNKYNYFSCSTTAAKFCFNYEKIKKKLKIMGNGINYDMFLYNKNTRNIYRKKLNISDNTILYGNIGRFVPQKNHKYLLKLFYKVHKANNNSKLLIIGSGILKKSIERMINKLDLTESVILLGTCSNVYDYMQAMDVFVFPSKYEGLGIVLVEAQASDLPVITSTKVPKSVKITEKICFINLKKFKKWINNCINCNVYNRKNNKKEMENSIYNIKKSTELLEKEYYSISKKEK